MITEEIVIAENFKDKETQKELKERALNPYKHSFLDKISIKNFKIKEEDYTWYIDDDNYIKDSYCAILIIDGNLIYALRMFVRSIKAYLRIGIGFYEKI